MEKLLVTSNFSFSLSVFRRFVLQTRKIKGLFGKGLSLSWKCHRQISALHRTIPNFNDLEAKRYLQPFRENEKMPVVSIFLFSHNVFYPIKDMIYQSYFELHLDYRLQILSIWTGLKVCCLVKN